VLLLLLLLLLLLRAGVSPQPPQQPLKDREGVSVIQHTSSFEKQEGSSAGGQEPPEPKARPSASRLIRQPNIQVPEILVTVEPDADMPSVSPPATVSSSKVLYYLQAYLWALLYPFINVFISIEENIYGFSLFLHTFYL